MLSRNDNKKGWHSNSNSRATLHNITVQDGEVDFGTILLSSFLSKFKLYRNKTDILWASAS